MARKPPLITIDTPISAAVFALIDQAVRDAGYADAIEYSEGIPSAKTAKEFASAAIYVIANGGMANSVALPIYERCMKALRDGKSVTTVFGHPGKGAAMDWIWKHRRALYRKLKRADDVVEFCGTLPWVGVITKFHLAKNIGVDVAKPDVHLNRLAEAEGATAQELCDRLAKETGYRAATIDLILWRACADGIIHSR